MGIARARGAGRPPKLDDRGTATRERLLEAATAACVERGFEGATVHDIARRAKVSGPAIYHWFGGREALLVAAGRHALDAIGPGRDTSLTARGVLRAFLSDEFAPTRRLLAELHLAGQRHAEVAALLADWHRYHGGRWAVLAPGPDRAATVAAFFTLLLGACQIDSLVALGVPTDEVRRQLESAVEALFGPEGS